MSDFYPIHSTQIDRDSVCDIGRSCPAHMTTTADSEQAFLLCKLLYGYGDVLSAGGWGDTTRRDECSLLLSPIAITPVSAGSGKLLFEESRPCHEVSCPDRSTATNFSFLVSSCKSWKNSRNELCASTVNPYLQSRPCDGLQSPPRTVHAATIAKRDKEKWSMIGNGSKRDHPKILSCGVSVKSMQ